MVAFMHFFMFILLLLGSFSIAGYYPIFFIHQVPFMWKIYFMLYD